MRNDRGQQEQSQANFAANETSYDVAPVHDLRSVGNKVIFAPETPEIPKTPETPNESPAEFAGSTPESSTELGQIVSLEMPPQLEQPASAPIATEATDPLAPYEKAVLKTTSTLDKRAVKEIDRAMRKLNRDGNVADFYNTARDMMETNLDNSYKRKLGEAA